MPYRLLPCIALITCLLAGCSSTPHPHPHADAKPGAQATGEVSGNQTPATPPPGTKAQRHHDEIIVAGERFRIGTPVVLWTDPDGYDAYRTEARFAPRGKHRWNPENKKISTPNRYGTRFERTQSDNEFQQYRGGNWTLEELQDRVDLFVIHYDVCGTSRRCFEILHDHRGLSVHFMLDVDGTIYQTLDLKERAWHAGEYNDRSIGIEIANIGAYPPPRAHTHTNTHTHAERGSASEASGTQASAIPHPLSAWYRQTPDGRAQLIIPAKEQPWIRTPGFVGYSARNTPVLGDIHQRPLVQYDLTPQQYDALAKLTAALHRALPKIELTYPADEHGNPRHDEMTEPELANYAGLVGHYHLTKSKIDPGPAFQWQRVVEDAKSLR